MAVATGVLNLAQGIAAARRAKPAPTGKPTREELRERLAPSGAYPDDIVQPAGMFTGPELRVPRPPAFRAETPVVGGSRLARQYEELAKVVPEIRGRAHVLSAAMPGELIERLANETRSKDTKRAAAAAARLAGGHDILAGQTDLITKDIYVDPAANNREHMQVVAHEYQHLMGQGGGPWSGHKKRMANEEPAYETGMEAGQLLYPEYPPPEYGYVNPQTGQPWMPPARLADAERWGHISPEDIRRAAGLGAMGTMVNAKLKKLLKQK